jgi:hypothetical protein
LLARVGPTSTSPRGEWQRGPLEIFTLCAADRLEGVWTHLEAFRCGPRGPTAATPQGDLEHRPENSASELNPLTILWNLNR